MIPSDKHNMLKSQRHFFKPCGDVLKVCFQITIIPIVPYHITCVKKYVAGWNVYVSMVGVGITDVNKSSLVGMC